MLLSSGIIRFFAIDHDSWTNALVLYVHTTYEDYKVTLGTAGVDSAYVDYLDSIQEFYSLAPYHYFLFYS